MNNGYPMGVLSPCLLLRAKRNEGAEGVLVERKEAYSTCIDENHRPRINSFKMVVDTSDKNQYSYFYVLNLFLKLTRPNLAWLWRYLKAYISDSFIDTEVKFWHNLASIFRIVVLKMVLIYFIVWKLFAFRHRWYFFSFRQFFYNNFRLNKKLQILMILSEISGSDLSDNLF